MSATSGGAARRGRRVLTGAAGALLLLDLLVAAAPGAHAAPQLQAHSASRHSSHVLPRRDWKYVAPYTFLVSLKRRAPGFATATARRPKLMVPKQWHHQTTMMPATAASKTRVRVRLARRPDESQAWVRFRAVRISVTTFSLVLDLSERRLYKFKAGRQVGSYPVGIGRPATPTPTGSYFIAFHASPNGPGYGQAMLETSAHSKVIKTFEGGNDAIIAIHGPITAASDAAIGTDGTRISNGCIRMHDRQLRKLIWVPDGTPLAIVP